jgi:hypothetical protein
MRHARRPAARFIYDCVFFQGIKPRARGFPPSLRGFAFCRTLWQLFWVQRKIRPVLIAQAWLTLSLGLACSSCALFGPPKDAASDGHGPVLLVSLDGLRPEFYQAGSGWDAPALKALAAGGAAADSAEPVYPSLTYPNHTTLVTGLHSAQHGVLSNTIHSPEQEAPASQWYWDASHLKAPTIWQRAQAAGRKTAILTWPVTVGARVDWLIPEIFASPPATRGTAWDLARERMDAPFARELAKVNEGNLPDGFGPRDQWIAGAAEHVLSGAAGARPDFTLVHIIGVDYAEHEFGKDSPEAHAALKVADSLLGRILSAAEQGRGPKDRATVLLVGDHGFYDYDKLVRPATLWAREPWAPQVALHPAGGSAAVYARGANLPEGTEAKIVALLKRRAGSAYRVLDREQLDRLKAFPGAICALDPVTRMPDGSPGYSIKLETKGPFIEKLPRRKGNHGPLPASDPQLLTGFVASGPGIAPGTRLGRIRLLDVAPTIASILGVPFPEAEGRPIELSR